MLVFLTKRIFNAALVMLAVAAMAFLIFRFVGDPVEMMVNEQASQAERDELRERLGLNQGVVTQFGRFVVNAAQGPQFNRKSNFRLFRSFPVGQGSS